MKSCLLRFAVLTLCLSFTLTSHGQEPLVPTKITFTSDLPLDSYQSATIIKKLTKAFALSGIEFKALRVPSSLSLTVANKGIVDGELSRVGNLHEITNHQYSNLIKIDHKMLSVWVSAFAINKNIRIHSLSDLGNYSVCYTEGRKFFDDTFSPLIKPGRLMTVDSDRQAFDALAKGQVDIVITTYIEGKELIEAESKFEKIKEVKPIIELPIYSYIHKKNKDLLPALLANLARVDPQRQSK